MADVHFQVAKHDLSILDPSTGNTIGFVLSKDEQGNPFYQELDGQALVDLYSTSPTQISTNPEEELILGTSSYHAGFGLQYGDLKDPYRYFQSYNMFMWQKGVAMAGWDSTALTVDQITWTSPTGHVDGGSVWANETNAYDDNTGTYATDTAVGQNTYTDYLELTMSSADITGVRVWGSCEAATVLSGMDVDIYYGSAWHDVFEGTCLEDAWNYFVCQASAVTAMRVRIKHNDSDPHDLYLHEADFGVVTSGGTKGVPYVHADFDDKMFVGCDDTLFVLDSTGAKIQPIYTFGANITALQPFQIAGVDYLFVALGTGTAYEYFGTMTGNTARLVTSTATDNKFKYFAWVNTTVDTLYGAVEDDGTNTIRSTVNPLNGGTAWSAQTIVGDAATAITNLLEKDGALLIDKEDMPYYLDSSGNVQKDLAPECISGKSTHSGKNSTVWQGVYYRPTGDQALLSSGKYSDGSIGYNQWIQPSKFTSNNSDFSGQVEACAGDEEFLYVATDNDTKVEIWQTREEVIDGSRRVWHPIHELTLSGVETMWVSSVYKKRLWIASTNSSDSIYYLPLPTKYGDLTSDDERNFKDGAYFVTPFYDGGFPKDTKALIKVTATLGHAYDANIYFECHYQKLGDSSWTDMGDLKGSATSRTHTLYITSSTSSPMFRFKLVAKTDDSNKTPELLGFSAKCLLYPDVKDLVLMKVRVGQNTLDKNGQPYSSNYELQKTCLDNVKAATYTVTIKEYIVEKGSGTTFYGKRLPLPRNVPWRRPVKKEKGRDVEWEYTLLFLKVPRS